MNKYSLELIERLLEKLYCGWSDPFPEPENETEEKLRTCACTFLTELKDTFKNYDATEKDYCFGYAYAYDKIYAFYNAVKGWYFDAYIWEKEANSYMLKINVGTYCLIRNFMSILENYRDGRI